MILSFSDRKSLAKQYRFSSDWGSLFRVFTVCLLDTLLYEVNLLFVFFMKTEKFWVSEKLRILQHC